MIAMWPTIKPYIEIATAAYWTGNWLTGLETYEMAVAWLKTAIPF